MDDRAVVETRTEEVCRTLVVPLETSYRKNQFVEAALEPVQMVMARTADVLPSYPPRTWGGRSSQLYRQQVKDRPDSEREVGLPDGETKKLKANVLLAAIEQVSSNFATWRSNGKPGNRPSRDRYLQTSYLPLKGESVRVISNDRGYGFRAKFISYADPVWWHMQTSQYHERYLERIIDGDAEVGYTELHLGPDGDLTAHISVSWNVEVISAGADVDRYLGVYISPSVLYAGTVVELDTDSEDHVVGYRLGDAEENQPPETGGAPIGDVLEVEIENADEYQHRRDMIRQQRQRRSRENDLRGVQQSRSQFRRYTDQITDQASRRIVDIAADHYPCRIRMSDLTGLREDLDSEDIHSWPYRLIQEKIAYKAKNEGIPVETVPTPQIRRTCRHCGTIGGGENSTIFECLHCGYSVNSAINAAFNIASGGVELTQSD